ncbi:MAG: HAD hydrolase-like protein [Bacillota bacterium]|nr:HAD hydrolase-like protein [Bacillota bacterium]
MLKAILFDFDGVLTLDATGSQTICNYICKETGIDKQLFTKEYKKYNTDLLYGKLKHEDIWGEVCAAINTDISIEVLRASFINTPINEDMLNLIKELKSRAYKTAMVTDNKKDRIDKVVEYYNLDTVFDAVTVSAEVGSGKDKEAIFIKTMERLNVSANECVFIDNQKGNLIVPKQMGMEVIFYDHEEKDVGKLINQLMALGIY